MQKPPAIHDIGHDQVPVSNSSTDRTRTLSVQMPLQAETVFVYAWEQLDVGKWSSLITNLSLSHLRIFLYTDLSCLYLKTKT
jgi:hypothetical protein